ncbi:MAG: hypothetical protein EBT75_11240 [Proteobacteria bacterium]|nr:hypothetical protein [Pseudomonadota bacterium]NBS06722.1 hypothetical protein [Verrucomicrobiota bacterium]NBS79725.1 hypothetical protein [bacterium]
MKRKLTLTLDPWSQFALWLIVILLASDRLKSFLPVSTAFAQESRSGPMIDVNVVQVGGSKVSPDTGIPIRQVGPPPTSRVGPANFPFQKVEQ